MRTAVIYMYAFLNGRNYVGQSWNFKERHTSHRKLCRRKNHDNEIFQRCFDKYGLPEPVILADGIETQSELNRLETLWFWRMSAHKSVGGVNIKFPGSHGKHAKSTRKKMSESQSGEKHHMWGKTHTPEAIEKIRVSSTGRKQTPEIQLKKFNTRRKNYCQECGQLLLFEDIYDNPS